VLLAELIVRHTRYHMPTRRVALEHAFLPMSGGAPGALLLGAVARESASTLDEESLEVVPRLLADARRGLSVPRIALRHRLQIDTHGLDRSRHRVLGEAGRLVVELDLHGAPVPQLLGAVLGVARLQSATRPAGIAAVQAGVDGRWFLPPGVTVRRLEDGWGRTRPPAPGVSWRPGAPPDEQVWTGVVPEQRWAMEVLGLGARAALARSEINRRFRRLLREAHPDHGAERVGAAERIAELTEARDVLLDLVEAGAVSAGD